MSTDPAPETDREMLDRLLPGWVFNDRVDGFARVLTFHMNGDWCVDRATAVSNFASALRAILARDRETRGEVKAETPPLRRVPVAMVPCDGYVVVRASDGTIWRCLSPVEAWCPYRPLPQPGEDGGE